MPTDSECSSKVSVLDAIIRSATFIDLSPVIRSNMHGWQEHPDASIIHDARNHQQHGYYLQMLVIPEHVGSHVDAPAHVLADRMECTVESLPVDGLMAPGKLVDVSDLALKPGETVSLDDFQRLSAEQAVNIERGDILLVRFDWDHYLVDPDVNTPSAFSWWGGNEPGFSEELCAWIADRGLRAVGTDTAACDMAVKDGKIVAGFGHSTYFLPNQILIVEGLRGLDRLPSAFYFLATPLRIHQGSGFPIRALGLVPGE